MTVQLLRLCAISPNANSIASRLSESEQRFRGAFSHSAVGIALISLDGRWLQANDSVCRILGCTEQELVATTFQALIHPDDLSRFRENWHRAVNGTVSHFEMENRYLHKTGRTIWATLTVSLVKNVRDELLYFVAQLQDVTERRQSQIEVERARLELAHIGRLSLAGQLTRPWLTNCCSRLRPS
ncbi:MAG: PAS domain S-box protein [Steroidobacteraceae bacterium]